MQRKHFTPELPGPGMKKRRLLILGMVLAVLVLLVVVSWDILRFSYVSTAKACFPETRENLEQKGYVSVGRHSVEPNGTSKIEIFVPPDPRFAEIRKTAIKHEFVHEKQSRQHRVFGCQLWGAFRFLNEVEAYVGQRLPDSVYGKVYGKIPA